MHPILARRGRLALYLAVWIVFGGLLAGAVTLGGEVPLRFALRFALPLGVLLGFQSLACWYLVRVLPAAETPWPRLVATWLGATIVSLAVWVAAGLGWTRILLAQEPAEVVAQALAALAPLLVFAGAIGFALAVLGHYLAAAFERAREIERRALELQVFARDAELKSLRAQLDPHFLFNSLNSVAALIGTDAPAARRMCFLMAGFFRKSLGLGRRESIPLAEEIYLAETFLAIEEVRFGARLRTRFDVAEDALTLAVPPLLLQPLVENAVHHGVAHLIEGGEVRVRARRREGLLELAVENPCDPERPASRGAGVGLANVRSRVETIYGHRARVDVEGGAESYRVAILLPATPAAG